VRNDAFTPPAAILFCLDPHTAGMHMRKASSPRVDVSLRTQDVIGLCALSRAQLDAQGLLGADFMDAREHVRLLHVNCSTACDFFARHT
jgi:hypothetical protein